ncbi:MAG: hypothetical protein IJ789_08875 [Bacteroidales bacterium]|nr:hypothetical protein [Bacteroidales bacterium]
MKRIIFIIGLIVGFSVSAQNPFFYFDENKSQLIPLEIWHSRVPNLIQININIMREFVAIRHAISDWQGVNLKVEQLSHRVDNLNARVDGILHEQNENNVEMDVQIDAITTISTNCARNHPNRGRISGINKTKNDRGKKNINGEKRIRY